MKAPLIASQPRKEVRPCRLLYLVGELHAGGLERQLYYLLKSMDRERYRPAVAVWNYREDDVHVRPIRELGVPLYAFPRAFSSLAKLQAFSRLVRRLKPEIVHSYTFYTNFAAYWAIHKSRGVAVGSVRSDLSLAKQEAGFLIGRLSARWPAHQICNSSSAAEGCRKLWSPFLPRKLDVVRNALDLSVFQSQLLAGGTLMRVLGVGSLLPVKRWDLVLTAAVELKRRGFRFLIRIAGDGPLRRSLEGRSRDLMVDDCVQFLGDRDDIAVLLGDSSFLVHTADSEGCPNAVMEAMACGRAVVATDAGDIPFLVEDGIAGFVVRRGDGAALVERLTWLMNDHGLCDRMGKAARTVAVREFALKRLVEQTLASYRSAGWRHGLSEIGKQAESSAVTIDDLRIVDNSVSTIT